jgi:hypothetical protein
MTLQECLKKVLKSRKKGKYLYLAPASWMGRNEFLGLDYSGTFMELLPSNGKPITPKLYVSELLGEWCIVYLYEI